MQPRLRNVRATRSAVLTSALVMATTCSGASTNTPSSLNVGASSGATASSSAPVVAQAAGHIMAPEAFAIGPDGRLYFSDCPAGRIFRLGSGGKLEVVAGSGAEGFETGGFSGDGGPATQARLACPGGLAFDPRGDLFVADAINNRVRMIDPAGVITTVVGSGPTGLDLGAYKGDGGPAAKARLEFPNGLAFDAAGNLYIADHGNDAIRMIDRDNVITTVAGTGVGGFSGDGGPATRAQLHGPWSTVFDPSGNLYFTDKENGRIRMIDGQGVITTIAGTGEGQSKGDGVAALKASFVEPYGLALDTHGNLYISDDMANVIREIDTEGTISTIAGTGKQGSSGDGGAAVDAELNSPFGLLVDPRGSLYVADGGNGCVRMIDVGGSITSAVCA